MTNSATTNMPLPLYPFGVNSTSVTDDADDLLQSLDAVDNQYPARGVPAGSPTEMHEDVLDLEVELDIDNARHVMQRFQQTRRELDAEIDD